MTVSPDPKELRASWEWDRPRFYRAQGAMWHHRFRRRGREQLRYLLYGAAAFVLGLLMFDSPVAGVIFAVFVTGSSAIGGLVGQRVQTWMQARQFEKTCLPKYGTVILQVSARGVEITSGDTATQHGWSVFQRAVETSEFFLLYTAPAGGYFIPKSALLDQDTEEWRLTINNSVDMQS